MKFLADECFDAGLVEVLRSHSHDVLYAMETLHGETDDTLLARAYDEHRIILTEDKDFGELVYRLQRPAYGIILLRFDVVERNMKESRLLLLLEQEAERLADSLTVLETDKIRIRPLQ